MRNLELSSQENEIFISGVHMTSISLHIRVILLYVLAQYEMFPNIIRQKFTMYI